MFQLTHQAKRHVKLDERKQRYDRLNVHGNLLIADKKNNEVVGKLINISESGVCLLVSRKFAVRRPTKDIVILVGSQRLNKNMSLQLERVWFSEINLSPNYLAGYKIMDSDLKTKNQVKAFIEMIKSYQKESS